MNQLLLIHVILLILGAVTSFLAIFTWARFRTLARLCTVLGVLCLYGALVYRFVLLLRIPHTLVSETAFNAQTLLESCVTALPFLFFLTSFILSLTRKH